MGKFEDCSCVNSKKSAGKGNWWGGCNENIKFGEVMAKHFLEAIDKGNSARTLLNLHNNEIGRKVSVRECPLESPLESEGYIVGKRLRIVSPTAKII
jgi:hypothetical protein